MKSEYVEQPAMSSALAPPRTLRLFAEPLVRLRAVILLAGTVRPSALSRSIGRSLLDLPTQTGCTVLDVWKSQGEDLASAAELEMPLRIMIDDKSRAPVSDSNSSLLQMSVERDPAPFRGTGGVLRDVCSEYDPDDVVLVANAGQILIEPLERLAQELSAAGGDVALLTHGDGTPSGLMLVRCGVLNSLRRVGFLDFKEQVLPELGARGEQVRIIRRPRATGVPVRTLDGYIAGLRSYHREQVRPSLNENLQEEWRPAFSIVEEGAQVDPDATIHDSVVLAGGRVQCGAVVVRSVVCPGGVVRAGATVADMIIAGPRDRSSRSRM
jgi:hypothetical protein